MKVQSLFLLIVIVFLSCKELGYSKALCDETFLHEDNKQNDTSKVILEQRTVFDTTTNMLRGVIIDKLTNTPIIGARVYIWNGYKNFSILSDVNGNFQFFKDDFSGIWQMSIFDPGINV
jgi:hypothetical protein